LRHRRHDVGHQPRRRAYACSMAVGGAHHRLSSTFLLAIDRVLRPQYPPWGVRAQAKNATLAATRPDAWAAIDDTAAHVGVRKDSMCRCTESRGLATTRVGKSSKRKLSEIDARMRARREPDHRGLRTATRRQPSLGGGDLKMPHFDGRRFRGQQQQDSRLAATPGGTDQFTRGRNVSRTARSSRRRDDRSSEALSHARRLWPR
jgi:hypothetical protein